MPTAPADARSYPEESSRRIDGLIGATLRAYAVERTSVRSSDPPSVESQPPRQRNDATEAPAPPLVEPAPPRARKDAFALVTLAIAIGIGLGVAANLLF